MALAGIREQELRAAVSVLGLRRVSVLNYVVADRSATWRMRINQLSASCLSTRRDGSCVRPLGVHDGHRHTQCVGHCVAGGQLSPVTARRIRAAEESPVVAARSLVGKPVVLSGLQHRERREGPRDRLV